MDRRTLLHVVAAACGAAVAASLRAQAYGPMPLVIIVSASARERAAAYVDAFMKGVQEPGQPDVKSFRIESRFANGDTERLRALTREALDLKPDVIVVTGLIGAQIARGMTATVPIVVATSSDLADAGLVHSLARPGGNVTGVSDNTSDSAVKRLELTKLALPRATRVALMVNPDFPSTPDIVARVNAAAAALRVDVARVDYRDRATLMAAIDGVSRTRPDAILMGGDSVATSFAPEAIQRANAVRIPIVYYWPGTAEQGALLSYQADIRDNYRRAAGYVLRILKGEQPGNMPVHQPNRYDLVVNARVARELGIDLPKSLLVRADRVIQ